MVEVGADHAVTLCTHVFVGGVATNVYKSGVVTDYIPDCCLSMFQSLC